MVGLEAEVTVGLAAAPPAEVLEVVAAVGLAAALLAEVLEVVASVAVTAGLAALVGLEVSMVTVHVVVEDEADEVILDVKFLFFCLLTYLYILLTLLSE